MGINHTRALKIILSAATIVAALGLSACSPQAPETTTSTTAVPPRTAAQQSTGLPPSDALTDVLARLSDPAVPGSDKLMLVEGATSGEAADLDKFAKALQDNRMLPLTFAATDLAWSPDTPGNVTANVTVTPADPGVAPFSFPMEFASVSGGWRLSRQTADLLLASSANLPTPTPTR